MVVSKSIGILGNRRAWSSQSALAGYYHLRKEKDNSESPGGKAVRIPPRVGITREEYCRMSRQDEFLKLLLRHQTEVKGFIGSLVLDRHLRDDVFQEVAVALWQQMDRYDWDRPFASWARGIAANKILQLRDKDARFPVPFSPQTIQAILDEFDRTEDTGSAQLDALRECLQGLPPHSRRLLELRYERNLACE